MSLGDFSQTLERRAFIVAPALLSATKFARHKGDFLILFSIELSTF